LHISKRVSTFGKVETTVVVTLL